MMMRALPKIITGAAAVVILTMPAASVPTVRPSAPAPAGQGVTPGQMDARRTIPPCRCGER